MKLENRVAIITGGAQGIGKAITLKFAAEGAKIAVFDIKEAEDTKSDVEKLNREFIFLKVDVSHYADVSKNMKEVIDRFSQIDILVNNAGITKDTLLVRMSEEDWDKVLNINLKGVFNMSKEVVKYMMKKKSGRIINISSIIGLVGNPGQANYAASKAGIIGLTKSVAKEFAKRGITVNAIAPGYIKTPMTDVLKEDAKNRLKEMIPLGEIGTPEDVANLALFLASDDARYITGQVINVDGGMVMS